MSKLFSKIRIGQMELPNRLGIPPMCQFSAKDGFLQPFHLCHYGGFAKHGVSSLIVEATAVSPIGRIAPSDAGIWKDEHVPSHRQVVEFCQSFGTKVGLQIAHAGRKASIKTPWLSKYPNEYLRSEQGGWPDQIVAPSPIPWLESNEKFYPTPNELTLKQIEDIISQFGSAARRANEAGYDFLEIHAAHGYLLSEFLSPLTNKRRSEDPFGGSFANRIRIILEVIKEVKRNIAGNKPVGIRFSCTDYVQGGWSVQETAKLSKLISQGDSKVDFIDCSSGAIVDTKIDVFPGYQVPFARVVKEAVNGTDVVVMAVGLITDPDQCEKILQDGSADMVLVGRQFLKEPSFAQRAAIHFGSSVKYAPQYTAVGAFDQIMSKYK